MLFDVQCITISKYSSIEIAILLWNFLLYVLQFYYWSQRSIRICQYTSRQVIFVTLDLVEQKQGKYNPFLFIAIVVILSTIKKNRKGFSLKYKVWTNDKFSVRRAAVKDVVVKIVMLKALFKCKYGISCRILSLLGEWVVMEVEYPKWKRVGKTTWWN